MRMHQDACSHRWRCVKAGTCIHLLLHTWVLACIVFSCMMQPEDEAGLAVGSTGCGRSAGCGAASVDKFAAGSSTGTFVHEKSLHVTACVHDMYMHIRA